MIGIREDAPPEDPGQGNNKASSDNGHLNKDHSENKREGDPNRIRNYHNDQHLPSSPPPPPPPQPPPPPPSAQRPTECLRCVNTDLGNQPSVGGRTQILLGGRILEDSRDTCVGRPTLNEFYCKLGKAEIVSRKHKCEPNCRLNPEGLGYCPPQLQERRGFRPGKR